MLSRRELLARLAPIAAYPLLAAHHRPGHAGGPPATRVTYLRVAQVYLQAPAAGPTGAFDPVGFDAAGFQGVAA